MQRDASVPARLLLINSPLLLMSSGCSKILLSHILVFSKTVAYTTPQKFENTVLFVRLGLPPTLVLHEIGGFQKSSSKRGVWVKMWTKKLENRAFWKGWQHGDNHVISLPEFSSHKSNNEKKSRDCCLFKFLRRVVDEKHFMRFESEIVVFKFL